MNLTRFFGFKIKIKTSPKGHRYRKNKQIKCRS